MKAGDAWEHLDGTDVLRLGPRHARPVSDDLVAQVFHRTTGGGRSALLNRAAAESLRNWLTRWLEEGWDGVARECGQQWFDDGCAWACTVEPGGPHVHDGKPVYWRAETGRPGRRQWTADGEVS